mgnify:CR=1 FL=1
MDIRRDFYLEKLIKRKSNGLIKVITGIRRCGKSYLLNNIFYHHLLDSDVEADHIIRFAFDSADDLYLIGESLIQIEKEKRGVDPEKFMAYIRSKTTGEGIYYLLLAEIQMLDCFEAVLEVTQNCCQRILLRNLQAGVMKFICTLSALLNLCLFITEINIPGYLNICFTVEFH